MGIRHADGLWLVIETEPLAGSFLQIHADIMVMGTALCVTGSARARGLDRHSGMLE